MLTDWRLLLPLGCRVISLIDVLILMLYVCTYIYGRQSDTLSSIIFYFLQQTENQILEWKIPSLMIEFITNLFSKEEWFRFLCSSHNKGNHMDGNYILAEAYTTVQYCCLTPILPQVFIHIFTN